MTSFTYFNSIKVQLEPNLDWLPREKQAFQFHKGTIRTRRGLNLSVPQYAFQFHKGTIRTASDFVIPELDSIFQFHKGTIRTRYNGAFCFGLKHISIP